MKPETIAYLERAIVALKGDTTPQEQLKILKVISQMTQSAAADIHSDLIMEAFTNA